MKVPFCNLAAVNAELARPLYEAYSRVMKSGQLILGPEVEAFEQEWAAYCGKSYCVGAGNATDAITLMLRGYTFGAPGTVIVPAHTCFATWVGISRAGLTPSPVDVDEDGLIDPSRIADALRKDTKAILAVHLYGKPAPMAALRDIAFQHDLPLLVDAAQAHGIKGDDLGDCSAFSFYPTKNLGALGDGGAVVTDDNFVARDVALLRNYGSSEKNVHELIGVNSRLDELQAAFLRAKLPYLDEFNARRQRNASIYGGGFDSVWHQFVVRAHDRDDYRARMAARGIETMVHYPTPPHLQPAYAHLGYGVGSFPIAERLAREVVSLPVGPEVSEEQANYVAETAMEYA